MKKNIALIVLAALVVYSCSLLAWGGWRGGWGWGGGPGFGWGWGAPYGYYGYPYGPYGYGPGVGLGFTFTETPKTPEEYKAKADYEDRKAARKAKERADREARRNR